MPYFPEYYPPMNWWLGKIFVKQGVDLVNQFLPGYEDGRAKYVFAEYTFQMARAVTALLQLDLYKMLDHQIEKIPASVSRELLARLHFNTKIEVSSKEDFIGKARSLLNDVKGVFLMEFLKIRENEYFYYFYEQLDIWVQEAGETTSEVVKALESDLEDEIMQRMMDEHDNEYWNLTECSVFAGFGGYGEYGGFSQVVEVTMTIG